MLTSKDLLKQQLEEIAAKPKKAKHAKGVPPDKAAARQYNAYLQRIAAEIHKDIKEIIMPSVKRLEPEYISDAWPDDITKAFARLRDKWSSPDFLSSTNRSAQKFVRGLSRQNKARFAKSVSKIGITSVDIFGDSPKLQDILAAATSENARLIKSIPIQHIEQAQTIVMTNMRAGLKPSSIVAPLQKALKISKRRAALIARDQTSKATGELSKQRQIDTGFEFFRWVDSGDSRVRDDHERIADKDVGYGKGVYRWDKPPKNKDGVAIIPSQEINCRCVAVPVTSRQVAENKLKG